ncbi:hypothetical protein VNO78_04936 [Psophocarpus tetragonolobus]|uniref:Uncharacterized protein n=1 Tax=Psophocarpus tetragonolobus TaxID=3891 RepID=A0AAN9XQM0_PSOTE
MVRQSRCGFRIAARGGRHGHGEFKIKEEKRCLGPNPRVRAFNPNISFPSLLNARARSQANAKSRTRPEQANVFRRNVEPVPAMSNSGDHLLCNIGPFQRPS